MFSRWQVDEPKSGTEVIPDTSSAVKTSTSQNTGSTVSECTINSSTVDKVAADTVTPTVTATISKNNSAPVSEEELTKATLEADRLATSYLGTFLLPVAVGMVIRSLIVDKHASWYSWGIGALTGFVYTFGFVMMCPQLFINHKLKSVAFLPWKFLIYKFLNTFIDGTLYK